MTWKSDNGNLTLSSHITIWIAGIIFVAGSSFVTFATKSDVEKRASDISDRAHQELLQERAEREHDMKEIRAMNTQILQLLNEKQDRRR